MFAQQPKLSPYKKLIGQRIAEILEIEADASERQGQNGRRRRRRRPKRNHDGPMRDLLTARMTADAILEIINQSHWQTGTAIDHS